MSSGGTRTRLVACAATVAVATACVGGTAEAQAAEWQTATAIPSTSVNTNSKTVAGLADDGSAAIAYVGSSDVRVATRQGSAGSWSVRKIQEGAQAASFLSLDMNAAGDIVVGFSINQGNGFAIAAYKPAGGAWEATKYLDESTKAPSSGGFDVAINSKGDAVAGWVAQETGTPPKRLIRAVARTKAGGWPGSPQTVASEEILTTKGTVGALTCGGPAIAVDDTGRGLAAWSSVYGSFEEDATHEAVVCGVRQSLWNGSSWGAPADLSPRPNIGWMSKATSGGPDTGIPIAASDPVSGALGVVFRSNPSAWDKSEFKFSEGWTTDVLGGSVAGGAGGGLQTPALGSGDSEGLALGITEKRMAVATFETNMKFESTYAASAGLGVAGGGLGLGTISSGNFNSVSADAGGDGSGFAIFDQVFPAPRKTVVWTAAPGGSYLGPTTMLENTTILPSVAANCHGDAIAASGGTGGLFHADYVSGNTGACGSGEKLPEKPPEEGANPGPAKPPSAGPPEIEVERPRPTDDGKVRVVFTTPNGGLAVFQSSASVSSGDLATGSAKKQKIVVTKKSVNFPGPGTKTIVLAPSAKAKRVIKKKGKLAAKLSITFTAPGLPVATATQNILFKAPKGKKKGK